MGLFKKKKQVVTSGYSAPVYEADYESVLGWLTGLSPEDYKKVCAVADIYREADQSAAAELGEGNEPTTFINPPEPKFTTSQMHVSLNDDDFEPPYLEMDIKAPKGKRL